MNIIRYADLFGQIAGVGKQISKVCVLLEYELHFRPSLH